MYIQGVESVFDIFWGLDSQGNRVYYKDVHKEGEYEFSKYHFEVADITMLFNAFESAQGEAKRCLEAKLPLPAYDYTMLASHYFNVLDARKAISVAQRQNYILQIRELAKACAMLYKEQEDERELRIKQASPQS